MKNKIETDNSPEYPFGNMIEPYDIQREQDLIDELEQKETAH